MSKEDLVGKTYVIDGERDNWKNHMMLWNRAETLKGTITIDKVTDKDYVCFTIRVISPRERRMMFKSRTKLREGFTEGTFSIISNNIHAGWYRISIWKELTE